MTTMTSSSTTTTSSSSSPIVPQPLIHSLYLRSLLAGALAGTLVDTTLFPLDTLKTRLQASAGFFASGGFRGVYNGIGSAVVGSAPGAALFFVSYEGVKRHFHHHRSGRDPSTPGEARGNATGDGILGEAGTHMLAASVGEIAACAVRVPTEVVKQRAQAAKSPREKSSWRQLKAVLDMRERHGAIGVWRELYRGWGITVLREVPFTVVQFPLWEGLKRWSLERRRSVASSSSSSSLSPRNRVEETIKDVPAWESALYGSLSGAVAAGVTTPLDVLKTRLMLATERVSIVALTTRIWREEGGRVFFSGIGPRTMWISIGGAVFLGSYQWASNFLGGV